MKVIFGIVVALVLVAGVWYFVTVPAEDQAPAKDETATTDANPRLVPRPRVPRVDRGPRALSDETRDILIYELSALRGKPVWFVRQANDPETDSFQREIEDAFLESGWEIASSTEASISLRSGIRVFVADAVLPDHVSIAVDGLRKAGFEVFAGNGYRAFYEKKKAEDPDFSGIALAPEQDFVIVVGPKPPARRP